MVFATDLEGQRSSSATSTGRPGPAEAVGLTVASATIGSFVPVGIWLAVRQHPALSAISIVSGTVAGCAAYSADAARSHATEVKMMRYTAAPEYAARVSREIERMGSLLAARPSDPANDGTAVALVDLSLTSAGGGGGGPGKNRPRDSERVMGFAGP